MVGRFYCFQKSCFLKVQYLILCDEGCHAWTCSFLHIPLQQPLLPLSLDYCWQLVAFVQKESWKTVSSYFSVIRLYRAESQLLYFTLTSPAAAAAAFTTKYLFKSYFQQQRRNTYWHTDGFQTQAKVLNLRKAFIKFLVATPAIPRISLLNQSPALVFNKFF